MKNRQKKILRAIVEKFIRSASPVGSGFLAKFFNFEFSSATIRNEMRELERAGLLKSPHTSAGREPTTGGFRFFVSDLQTEFLANLRPAAAKNFRTTREKYFAAKRADEKVFDAISILSNLVENVAFATVPSARHTFFLGIGKMLAQPEFAIDPVLSSTVVRVLEEKFSEFLQNLDLKNEVQIFIGAENLLPEIQSCTLLVARAEINSRKIAVGILGPQRMDFARNILALENCLEFLGN